MLSIDIYANRRAKLSGNTVALLCFFLLQFAADARAESWQITNLVNFFYIF